VRKIKNKVKTTERQLLGSWFCYGSVWIQLGCSTGSCKMLQLKGRRQQQRAKVAEAPLARLKC